MLRPVRLLLAALLALSLLPAAASAASAAAPPAAPTAAKACKSGTFAVRVTTGRRQRTVCRGARGSARGAAQIRARARAARLTPAAVRAALPRRLRAALPLRRLTRLRARLDRATAAQLARPLPTASTASATAAGAPRARLAAVGATACAGDPTFQIDPVKQTQGGVTATAGGGGWVAGSGSTAGRLVVIDADAGNGVRGVQTTKDCISWDPCPDANGIVHGTYEYTVKEENSARAESGAVVRIVSVVTVTARLTARVGDDARVISFDWDADGRTENGGGATQGGRSVAHIPTRITRVHVRVRGVDPRDGKAPLANPYGAARGSKGAITTAELPIAQALYQMMTELIRPTAAKALLEAEGHWYRGKCLSAVFDPASPEVTPGQRVPVTIRVRAADGSEAQVPLELTPYDGAVGPPSGTAPLSVVYTAPQQLDRGPFTAFEVTSTSKRGRLEDFYVVRPAQAVPRYRVTFSGEGSYSRHEMGSGLPQVDARHTFAWRSTTAARFPFFDDLPAGVPTIVNADASELTGELSGWRTDGAGRRGCSTTPESDVIGVVRQTRTADGGFDMTIEPFPWLHPAGGIQLACDSGAFHFWSKGTRAAMSFGFHLSKAQLDARRAIVLPAGQQQPLDPDCYGGEANGEWECEQSVQWSGTVTLEPLE